MIYLLCIVLERGMNFLFFSFLWLTDQFSQLLLLKRLSLLNFIFFLLFQKLTFYISGAIWILFSFSLTVGNYSSSTLFWKWLTKLEVRCWILISGLNEYTATLDSVSQNVIDWWMRILLILTTNRNISPKIWKEKEKGIKIKNIYNNLAILSLPISVYSPVLLIPSSTIIQFY